MRIIILFVFLFRVFALFAAEPVLRFSVLDINDSVPIPSVKIYAGSELISTSDSVGEVKLIDKEYTASALYLIKEGYFHERIMIDELGSDMVIRLEKNPSSNNYLKIDNMNGKSSTDSNIVFLTINGIEITREEWGGINPKLLKDVSYAIDNNNVSVWIYYY